MIEAIRCIATHLATWLLSALVVLLVGGSWLLDGPSDSDHAATVAMDLYDALAAARAAKENHE